MKKVFGMIKNRLGLSQGYLDEYINKFKKNSFFTDIKITEGCLQLQYRNKINLTARLHPHSDILVLKQVFLEDEYKPVTDYFKDNHSQQHQVTIIDAGANAGYTAAYFKYHLPGSEIICVEPDPGNISILKKNLQPFIGSKSVMPYQAALMQTENKSMVVQTDFRDGKDWSLSVAETTGETGLKSVSVPYLMEQHNWKYVDILKIDIEGAERFVFSDDADLSYLLHVKFLVLEIHDEFGVRPSIYEKLKSHHFCILNFGETTIALNRRFLVDAQS